MDFGAHSIDAVKQKQTTIKTNIKKKKKITIIIIISVVFSKHFALYTLNVGSNTQTH